MVNLPELSLLKSKYLSWIGTVALIFLATHSLFAQQQIRATLHFDRNSNTIEVTQNVTFINKSQSEVKSLVFNDWNNAFSSNTSNLAKRFSDEFVRAYFLAPDSQKGYTHIASIQSDNQSLKFHRAVETPDKLEIELAQVLQPGDSLNLQMEYTLKIPSASFTRYGVLDSGDYLLKHVLLTPARLTDSGWIFNTNENLDDPSTEFMNLELHLEGISDWKVVSDLEVINTGTATILKGQNKKDFIVYLGKSDPYHRFHIGNFTIESSLTSKRVPDIQKALIVERIASFVQEYTGVPSSKKILVSDEDYLKNPVYGLNQLPSFLAPFPDSFLFELKFLKTFTSNYLAQELHLDLRKDNWIYDAFQVFMMMEYMERFYPKSKMVGQIAQLGILKSFHLVQLPFNDQYRYYYMLMARRNLDQALNLPKDELIKFNQQIASKYRAGLSFKYLDDYLKNDIVKNSMREFYEFQKLNYTHAKDLESIVQKNSSENLDWFFNDIIGSRKIIDYTLRNLKQNRDSISVRVVNRSGTAVPMPIFGIKKGQIVYKQWLPPIATDSTLILPRQNADRIALNYQNEVPEFNMRNNMKSLNPYAIGDRPLKFNFLKDLENPFYNQILYVPNLEYNLYDGITPGIRLHNKTLLDKPFVFDISPSFGLKSKELVGSASFAMNQYLRNSNWYQVRYSISGNYFHYAPDALYYRINPMVIFRRRNPDFRDNLKQMVLARYVLVHREPTEYTLDQSTDKENYGVFNLRFAHSDMEALHTFNYKTDIQVADRFGKLFAEVEYRRLFENNRQVNLRFFAGTFLYNQTQNDYFSFALDRPTDYLFDYNYYGRSESSGLFSQQLILSEGGFKSKLDTGFANQWMATANASVNIWNWIEAYADAGWVKNRTKNPYFAYDSGIRLNLVTDYFELYFPVYSNNGWEISQNNYVEKIRFIITIDPKTLIGLFTRKWL